MDRFTHGDGPWPDLSLIALLWVVAAVLIDPVGNFAINDDWTYSLAVAHILKDGTFAMPSGASANVIVQAYWGALFCLPFGLSYTALRISSLALALIGLWAAYGTAREMGARRSLALVTAATFAVAPLYLPLASTFMTDLPFTNLIGIAFYLFARGMRRQDSRFVVLGFVTALATILIRQTGLIFVIGFGVGYVAQSRASLKSILVLVGCTVFGLAMHIGFQHWMVASHRVLAGPPGAALAFGPGSNPREMAIAVVKLFVLITFVGVMALPLYCATGFASLIAAWRARPRISVVVGVLTIALQLVAAWNREVHFPDYGNNFTSIGLGPILLYDQWLLKINEPIAPLPSWIWTILFLLGTGVIAAMMVEMTAALIDLWRTIFRKIAPSANIWATSAALVSITLYAALVCLTSVRPAAYDRHLMPFIVPVALLILANIQPGAVWTRLRIASSAILIVAFGLFSIVATGDYLAWHRARLAATDYLDAMHVPPEKIDGGYEYNAGKFYAHPIAPDWSKPFERSWWWVYDDEYVVGAGPVPHYRIIKRFPHYRTLSRDWDEVVILRRLPGSRGEVDNYKPGPAR